MGWGIVVAQRAGLGAARDAGEVAKHLLRPAGAADRDGEVIKVLQIVHVILRGLHGDVVADVVLRVEIKGGRSLKTAAEAGEHVAGNIALRIAHLLRARAVDVDRPLGLVERLLNAQVGDARHVGDLLHQLLGQRAILIDQLACYLHVDLCRQAEVQDLADHVSRQVQ